MATKLLLVTDVEDLGRKGDVVTVKPGFARNRLIPMGAAIFADKNALKRQARFKEERLQQAIEDKKLSEELAKKFEGITLSKTVKVDHDGHMYGSVTVSDIIHLIQNELSITLEKRAIQLKHAIKETGTHNILLKLPEGVTAGFHLDVAAEGSEETAAVQSE